MAAGACQGSYLGEVIYSDECDLLYGPDDALGLPAQYGKLSSWMKMTYGVGKFINSGGSS